MEERYNHFCLYILHVHVGCFMNITCSFLYISESMRGTFFRYLQIYLYFKRSLFRDIMYPYQLKTIIPRMLNWKKKISKIFWLVTIQLKWFKYFNNIFFMLNWNVLLPYSNQDESMAFSQLKDDRIVF